MNKIKNIILLILVVSILTSCSYDIDNLTQTYRPELNESPISGVWTIEEILLSESRFSYEENDIFIFDTDLYASTTDIYTNPNYEIQKLNWSTIQSNNELWRRISLFEEDERINLIRINQEGKNIAEIIPVDEENAYLGSHNQILKISLQAEDITEETKAEIVEEYSSKNTGSNNNETFAVAIGYRRPEELRNSKLTNNKYETLIIYYDGGEYRLERVDGLLIYENSKIDQYEIVREESRGVLTDKIYLNGQYRPMVDADGKRQSHYFTVKYLSNNYLTLEYIKEEPNTLSTYSTQTKGGFTQLNSDDIIEFSSDIIYEYSRKIDNQLPLSQAVYNIGFERENGLSILKGRLVTEVDNKMINRDFSISGNFRINKSRETVFNLERRLRIDNPDMEDFYITPDNNKIIVINENNVLVYNVKNVKNSEEFIVERKENTDIISFNSFSEEEISILLDYINI